MEIKAPMHTSVPDTTTLTMANGVKVVVHDSLNQMTSYVLLEQQDWFEDEIKFLRRLLQPGDRVIDIGANCGVYSLSMAHTIGAHGKVWAFEPASQTAELLRRGIAANDFKNVVLSASALADHPGTAQLALHANHEHNELVKDGDAQNCETVELTTLDLCIEHYGWMDIDFIKIDAEGAEEKLIKGGQEFFAKLSPLVMYEIKAGVNVNMHLMDTFSALGYESYRLVPGLDLLIPFERNEPADGFMLNLFACKRDRAESLSARNVLLLREEMNVDDPPSASENDGKYEWARALAGLPYAEPLRKLWESTANNEDIGDLIRSLYLYCCSCDENLSKKQRFYALRKSLEGLQYVCGKDPKRLRWSSLARVAQDYGARGLAIRILNVLSIKVYEQGVIDPDEPFLPPSRRFDTIAYDKALGNWLLGGVLEALEQLSSFSSYFSGTNTIERLEAIDALGFASQEMQRRLLLIKSRFGITDNETLIQE